MDCNKCNERKPKQYQGTSRKWNNCQWPWQWRDKELDVVVNIKTRFNTNKNSPRNRKWALKGRAGTTGDFAGPRPDTAFLNWVAAKSSKLESTTFPRFTFTATFSEVDRTSMEKGNSEIHSQLGKEKQGQPPCWQSNLRTPGSPDSWGSK